MAAEPGEPRVAVERPLTPAQSEDFGDLELLDDAVPAEALNAWWDSDAVQAVAEQTSFGAVLLDDLIHRQLTLSLSVAAVFLTVLFALPLLNRLAPDAVALRVLGLPLSWIVLAVCIYPLLWLLGAYFTATARKYEDDFDELVRK